MGRPANRPGAASEDHQGRGHAGDVAWDRVVALSLGQSLDSTAAPGLPSQGSGVRPSRAERDRRDAREAGCALGDMEVDAEGRVKAARQARDRRRHYRRGRSRFGRLVLAQGRQRYRPLRAAPDLAARPSCGSSSTKTPRRSWPTKAFHRRSRAAEESRMVAFGGLIWILPIRGVGARRDEPLAAGSTSPQGQRDRETQRHHDRGVCRNPRPTDARPGSRASSSRRL